VRSSVYHMPMPAKLSPSPYTSGRASSLITPKSIVAFIVSIHALIDGLRRSVEGGGMRNRKRN